MKIRIKYTREEITEIVLANHVKVFGSAPKGEKWHCYDGRYSDWEVENVEIEPETNPAEAMEAKE